MANFQVSITNPSTGKVDITDSDDVLTIVDHSNYGDSSPEAGHSQSDFSDFRKLKIILPTGVEYLFSSFYSIGEGDADLIVPAGELLPLSTNYAYTSGDGIYWIYLYALPTYNATASYITDTNPYVYYNGKIYKCIQNGSGNTPDSSPAYWEEICDYNDMDSMDSLLPSKYRLAQRITLTSDMKEVWARRLYNANCINLVPGKTFDDLKKNEEWMDAIKLLMIMDSIPIMMRVDDWVEVENLVNFAKQIKRKYE